MIRTIVSKDQISFIKGRNIASHLRLFDIFNPKEQAWSISGPEFFKAFDSLPKKCIEEALDSFNFGPKFVGMVKIVKEGTESCIQNEGWLSS